MLRERTLAGMAAARVRGRLGGRRYKVIDPKKLETAKRLYEEGKTPVEQIAEFLGVSPATFYRRVKPVQGTNQSRENT